ncbi:MULTISPECIES: DUF1858 domain-containing protein [unclassified Aminobacter]|uniref:DUF1858 domain-containing protein n=1 Tax=unclassified Aminobacter TaxID=2644704 RepID=UPI000466DF31|nr:MULTISPECIES: DUF1858 domain-containing protein [unclassified Aminobacter]TWG49980.1 hybrid cluster-associated redox disulfide protein [Aminobacter sp. J44]TWH30159.1 hybrid cluster-associated redox disulfide protein [Aminobacter sp. J15]
MTGRYHDDMSMDEIMRRWPETIRTILDHGLLCVGCPIAPFHTVDDAVREHDIGEVDLRADLRAAITRSAGTDTRRDLPDSLSAP